MWGIKVLTKKKYRIEIFPKSSNGFILEMITLEGFDFLSEEVANMQLGNDRQKYNYD